MTSPDTAAPSDGDMLRTLSTLAEEGLADTLRQSEVAKRLAHEVAEELGIGRGWVTLALELLAPLIESQTKAGAGWIARTAAERLRDQLRKLPFFDRLEAAIINRMGKLEDVRRGEQEMAEVLNGRLAPTDVQFAKALSLDLQSHVQQLRNEQHLSQQMEQALDGIRTLLNPQPALRLPLRQQADDARLVFGAREVALLGRKDELAALDAFLDDRHPFRWWLIAGPSGQGKSRLALEFCLERGVLWRAGFLADPADPGFWYGWQPERPTLIVCDYAGGNPQAMREVVVALTERQAVLEFPVRLLLLERDADARAHWRQIFESGGNDGVAVRQSRYGPPLSLQGLDDDDLWEVIQHFCWKAGCLPPDRAETLENLAAVDPQRRPLFAHFLADAVAAGRPPRGWDRETLLRDVLQREEAKYWTPAGVGEQEKNLLALATMTGGQSADVLLSVDSAGLLPDEATFDPRCHEAMTGRPAGETLAPLEPDILGEFFVLIHLAPRHGADRRLDRLSRLSWDIAPRDRYVFLSHAAKDFPLEPVLVPLLGADNATSEQRYWWSAAIVNLCNTLREAGQMDQAHALWDRLDTLAQNHPSESALRERLAVAATNLIFCSCSNAGELAKARGLWDRLDTLVQAHPEELALRSWQAKGAVNLIICYGVAGRFGDARHIFDHLDAFARAHSDDPLAREAYARGASNVIICLCRAGELDQAREIWQCLVSFGRAHPDDRALHEPQANSAVELILEYGAARRFIQARRLLEHLEALAQDSPDEPTLRQLQALGTSNLILGYGNAGELGKARGLWDRLDALCQAHPDEPALRQEKAAGAFNLICCCREFGNEALADEIEAAIEADPALMASCEALSASLEHEHLW